MKRVTIDPLTRIEGHLRLEVEVDEATGTVQNAVSSGTAWRGIELILEGRDPRDAWAFVGRICGVCTSTHSLCSLRAVEDALGITIPQNANLIRNIMLSSQTVHDHTVHFYNLHALDFVSPVAALDADPAATARLQEHVIKTFDVSGLKAPDSGGLVSGAYPKDFPVASESFFAAIQAKVKAIVDSGQLGIFAANWWDHPDYQLLPPEVHLMGVAHYLHVLDVQREIVIPHVVFGGKNPHPHYSVGGMPCTISMDDMNAPVNTQRLAAVDASINFAESVVDFHLMPDLLAIGQIYVEGGRVDGGGLSGVRSLAFGDYPVSPYSGTANGDYNEKCLIRSNGMVENFKDGVDKATVTVLAGADFMDTSKLVEEVEHAWFKYPEGTTALHPTEGITDHEYTGPKVGTKTKWEELDENAKYSWIKTPTYEGKQCEVGPLAKYIVTYTKVKQGIIADPTWAEEFIVAQIDTVSDVLGVPAHAWLCSTVGRTAARALDAQLSSRVSRYFFDMLIANIKAGDTTTQSNELWEPNSWAPSSVGVGLVDAPRGGLGHWLHIENGVTKNYQCIVPTTWNAAPISIAGEHGAYEASMIDTHVADPDKPIEIARAIRSFDPCLACATHLFTIDGRERAIIDG